MSQEKSVQEKLQEFLDNKYGRATNTPNRVSTGVDPFDMRNFFGTTTDICPAVTAHPTLAKQEQMRKAYEDLKTPNKAATKFDEGKLDWSLVPFEAFEGMVSVLEFGKKKYSAWNWASDGGFSHTRLLNSMMRHMFAYTSGEDNDPESGLCHLYHAQCCLMFLTYYKKYPSTFTKDDRVSRV